MHNIFQDSKDEHTKELHLKSQKSMFPSPKKKLNNLLRMELIVLAFSQISYYLLSLEPNPLALRVRFSHSKLNSSSPIANTLQGIIFSTVNWQIAVFGSML